MLNIENVYDNIGETELTNNIKRVNIRTPQHYYSQSRRDKTSDRIANNIWQFNSPSQPELLYKTIEGNKIQLDKRAQTPFKAMSTPKVQLVR